MRVGITGRAQHGKDSSGQFLKEIGFRRYAFADQLKELALYVNPIVDDWGQPLSYYVEHDGGWEYAKKNPEVRRFLQELGTGVRKVVGEDAWVKALETQIERDGAWYHDIVITDVRFPNEFDWVKSLGGIMLRVKRPGFDNGLGQDHESERYIDGMNVDREIQAPDLDTLQDEVLDAVKGRGW